MLSHEAKLSCWLGPHHLKSWLELVDVFGGGSLTGQQVVLAIGRKLPLLTTWTFPQSTGVSLQQGSALLQANDVKISYDLASAVTFRYSHNMGIMPVFPQYRPAVFSVRGA